MTRKLKTIQVPALFLIPAMGCVAFIAFRFPEWILWFSYFTFLPTVFLIVAALSPLAKLRLGAQDHNTLSFFTWLRKLLLAQLALAVIFVSIFLAFMGAGPTFSMGNISAEILYLSISHYYPYWGIFPWAIYGFWGLVIAYMTYVRGLEPYPHCVGAGLIKGFWEPKTKAYSEGIIYATNSTAICLALVSSLLLFVYVIQIKYDFFPHFILSFVTITVLSFIIPFLMLKLNRKAMRKYQKRNISIARLLAILFIFIMPVLLYSGEAGRWMIEHVGSAQAQKAQCDCEALFSHVSFQVRLATFFWAIMMVWAPFAGSYIAKISKGRTVFELVLGVFLMPLILYGLYQVIQPDFQYFLFKLQSYKILVLCAFGALTLFFVLSITAKQKNSRIFYSGFMESQNPLNSSRLKLSQGTKMIGIGKFALSLSMALMGVIFLHTLGGWLLIHFQIMTISAMVIHIVYLGLIAFLWQLLCHRPKSTDRRS